MTFEELGVRPEIVKALEGMGITEPTPIQAKAIPLISSGRDVVGLSKTGSGKTAAFGIPLLCKISRGEGIQAVVLAPTRELAVQISAELGKFGGQLHLRIATIYGGVSMEPQIRALRDADILVGTPGRVLDHMQQGNVDFSRVRFAVLDEADKMASMGFIDDVERILGQTPKGRRVLLFGATVSGDLERLQRRFMRDPAVVKVESQVQAEFLKQYYYNIGHHEKFSLLVHLLKKHVSGQAIVFCSKRSTVEAVAHNLEAQGVGIAMIHGKLSQSRRLAVIGKFNRGHPRVLVASSVAARGLDIRSVTQILNYDLSQDPEEYIHRIGRTARAGDSGKAVTLLSERDHDAFSGILRSYDVNVEVLPREEFARLHFKVGPVRGNPRRPRRGGDSFSRKPNFGRGSRFGRRRFRR